MNTGEPPPRRVGGLSRRRFLASLAQAGGTAALGGAGSLTGCGGGAGGNSMGSNGPSPMPRRALGRTGLEASILGLGGLYIDRGPVEQSLATLDTAFDLGITYYDTAANYSGGESERRFGLWLESLHAEGRRDEVFLATKADARDRDGAARQIDTSLDRLRTDHIDLIQLHDVSSLDVWGQASGPSGALRALEEARSDGRARHIGITGHNALLLLGAADQYPFETVLCPLGIADRESIPLVEALLQPLVDRGAGVIGMKVFSSGALDPSEVDMEQCLRYTLSLPVTAALVGMASPGEVEQNAAWARRFSPMSLPQQDRLASEVARLVDTSQFHWHV